MPPRKDAAEENDPLWYKDAIIYELHVRSFLDSDGDGIGDFRGLTEKLDYLQDLGVTALWLLPFYPSPLKDDGYDIADYTKVNPSYGTLADFKRFLREAKRRGLKVITELVVNHTSDQHPWFERARKAKRNSSHRNYYVWNDDTDRYRDARIIFKDFEASNWSWDPVARSYYWHRFYSHQPDLNFDNPQVRKSIYRALDFWLSMGVDGFRLDAVPYLYEREGTNCENLPETHGFLKELRKHVDERHPCRMLLAEANQWPEDSVDYFGEGDECHMAFHFPVMPRLFMAVRMEDRFPIIDILDQTPRIPETSQWAVFLRNHDELTLEMVTDEERDYMYRVFAHDPRARVNLGIRRRLAPLLGNDRRLIELMNGLLFSLPGTPVIYYGDEIGMGDNIYLGDRNAVRTPMQWSPDRNAGFSRASPQRLFLPTINEPEYHYESVNVAAQQGNPNSLLWWMKRLIALRKRFQAFGRGTIEFLYPENHKVLCFIRSCDEERVLVVANLSRYAQCVELDLSEFEGMVPVELFGRTHFPPIGELPYFLTLGRHAFYWFSLTKPREELPAGPAAPREALPSVSLTGDLAAALRGRQRAKLEDALPRSLVGRRWFGGKSREIQGVSIEDVIPVTAKGKTPLAFVLLCEVAYVEGEPDVYVVPIAVATGVKGKRLLEESPERAIALVSGRKGASEDVLYDAFTDPRLASELLRTIARRRRLKGAKGEITSFTTPFFHKISRQAAAEEEIHVLKGEQTNSSVVFGERFILKLYRKVDGGPNPDLEVGRYLTEKAGFAHAAPVAGGFEYVRSREEPVTLGLLQGYVKNEGDAWHYTQDALSRYLDRALSLSSGERSVVPAVPTGNLLELSGMEMPEEVRGHIGTYLDAARLLGRRTAELHSCLARATDDPDLAPEPFSTLYQRSIYQSMRNLSGRVFLLLDRLGRDVSEEAREEARRVHSLEGKLLKRFRAVLDHKLTGQRIRCHGDYHLGQVLYTGNDFVIIDFEGEPARPLSERRIKRSPLRDVAGMLRSFHYAASAALLHLEESGLMSLSELEAVLDPWISTWYRYVSAAFLAEYTAVADGSFLPATEDLGILLDVYLLDKAVYELGYEINHRPTWIRTPLRGLLDLLTEEE